MDNLFILEPAKPLNVNEEKIDNVLRGFGSLIRDRRKEMKITSSDLAAMCGIGRTTLEAFERGNRPNISFYKFIKVCYILDIDLFKEAYSKALADEIKEVILKYSWQSLR